MTDRIAVYGTFHYGDVEYGRRSISATVDVPSAGVDASAVLPAVRARALGRHTTFRVGVGVVTDTAGVTLARQTPTTR